MTLEEFFETGQYADFLLIEDEVYILPLGYKLSINEQRKENIVSMANGHKRKDIIRRWNRYRFTYDTLLADAYEKVIEIRDKGLAADEIILHIRKENPASSADYDVIILDAIIPAIRTNHTARGRLFVQGGVTLEME